MHEFFTLFLLDMSGWIAQIRFDRDLSRAVLFEDRRYQW